MVIACMLIGMASTHAYASPDIRFGTLPVLQALSVFVAEEKGFFKEQGVDVELVPFNSAFERDVAFTSGQISGFFGDLLACMVLNANKIPVKIVSVVHNATRSQRMFALVISGKYEGKDPKEAFATGIAVSSNTILDYLTSKFLVAQGVPLSRAKLVEIKNIPIRLQMLSTGQVPAAVLPEPLAAFAEMKGAKILMDDAGKGWSATVIAFGDGFLAKNPDKARAFQKALDRAAAYINKNPEDIRPIMNRECRMPDQLKQSFPIPQFPKLALPQTGQVDDVSRWLVKKGTVKKGVSYGQTVADGYIP